VTVLTAAGGLLVAAVVKHADNILKTYATAIAILLTVVVSCIQTATVPSLAFVQGLSMAIASIFLYALAPSKPKPEAGAGAEAEAEADNAAE